MALKKTLRRILRVVLLTVIFGILAALLVTRLEASPIVAAADHPWRGRQVAFLGDSITDPNQPHKIYWQFLAEALGIRAYVYGKSGNRWCDIPAQAAKLRAEHLDVDAIVIFIGTNDFMGAVPLGEWFAVRNETVNSRGRETVRARRYPLMDKETVRGNANISLAFLKHEFPEAQIVLLTPIHRAFAWFTELNVQPDESYANALGLWVDSYVNVTKEAGNVWSVPVVDLNSVSGLYPLEKAHHSYFRVTKEGADARFADYLHPNAKGHRRLAETLIGAFSTLPCGFRAQE